MQTLTETRLENGFGATTDDLEFFDPNGEEMREFIETMVTYREENPGWDWCYGNGCFTARQIQIFADAVHSMTDDYGTVLEAEEFQEELCPENEDGDRQLAISCGQATANVARWLVLEAAVGLLTTAAIESSGMGDNAYAANAVTLAFLLTTIMAAQYSEVDWIRQLYMNTEARAGTSLYNASVYALQAMAAGATYTVNAIGTLYNSLVSSGVPAAAGPVQNTAANAAASVTAANAHVSSAIP